MLCTVILYWVWGPVAPLHVPLSYSGTVHATLSRLHPWIIRLGPFFKRRDVNNTVRPESVEAWNSSCRWRWFIVQVCIESALSLLRDDSKVTFQDPCRCDLWLTHWPAHMKNVFFSLFVCWSRKFCSPKIWVWDVDVQAGFCDITTSLKANHGSICNLQKSDVDTWSLQCTYNTMRMDFSNSYILESKNTCIFRDSGFFNEGKEHVIFKNF